MVAQIVVTVDMASGNFQIKTPDAVPVPIMVGWLETAKFMMLNNMLNQAAAKPQVVAADASILGALNKQPPRNGL